MFFTSAKICQFFVYWVRYGGLSFSYTLGLTIVVAFCCISLYDAEETMMDLYYEKEENRKEKMQWISILDSLPIFVLIYDKTKEKVKYINQHFKSTFFNTKFQIE